MSVDEWIAAMLPTLPPISDENWECIAAIFGGVLGPAVPVEPEGYAPGTR